MTNNSRTPNRLAHESSPYLLQHAYNPVDWYPWGEDAFARARRENRPLFLSIGYSACHWCHVMERESFESQEIATLLNEHFVAIKVDREERPDVDHIYMSFTQAMSGQGGWPMSVFLTPDLKPFFAGTYFPPTDQYGRPGFKRVLTELLRAWNGERDALLRSAEDIHATLRDHLGQIRSPEPIPQSLAQIAARRHLQAYDERYGGFGSAPKFPHTAEIDLLLRVGYMYSFEACTNASLHTLKAMAEGGIYDQLGGGFARYATDVHWRVPHFEKMLYDNTLLVPLYADGWKLTGDLLYKNVVVETLDWMIREMRGDEGAFFSAIDADSDGEEGRFYTWTPDEISAALDDTDARIAMEYFGITREGDIEGRSVLHRSGERPANMSEEEFGAQLERVRAKLLAARSLRVPPQVDDKRIVSWNGMAIRALCRGFEITGAERYRQCAREAASWILTNMYTDSTLRHTWCKGKSTGHDFLEDYAYFVSGLLALFLIDSDSADAVESWLKPAERLSHRAIALFQPESGEFFLRPESVTDLILRPKEDQDGSVPSSAAILLGNLVLLHRLTGDERFYLAAEKGFVAMSEKMVSFPAGMTSAIIAHEFFRNSRRELAIVGEGTVRDRMVEAVRGKYHPDLLLVTSRRGDLPLPLFSGRALDQQGVKAYYCVDSVCQQPVSTSDALLALLG